MDTLDIISTDTHIIKDGIKVRKEDVVISLESTNGFYDVTILYKDTGEDVGESALCGRESYDEALEEAEYMSRLHGLEIVELRY
jgi:hypothetical protein